MLRTHIKWLLPLLILALAIALFQLLKASRAQAPAQPAQERSWTVRTVQVEPGLLQPQIELYGAVEAPDRASLSAALEADVIALPAREGARVQAGDLLVRLDPRDAELALRQQQAQLDSLQAQLRAEQVRHAAEQHNLTLQRELVQLKEADLARYRNLAQRNLASQQQIDTARANLQQQRLNLSSLEQSIADHPNRLAQLQAEQARLEALVQARQLDLERTEVRAPYAARIARVQVARGDRVRSGDAMIDLYDLGRIEVRAQLPERVLAQVRQALGATQGSLIAHTELDGRALELVLDRLGATVSEGRAGVDALFRLQSGALLPEPGRSLSLHLTLPAQSDLIALPPAALYGIDRVYKVVNQRLQAVSVERVGQRTGPEGQPQILVRSAGLAAGDQVITTQLPNAVSGLKVAFADAAMTASAGQTRAPEAGHE